MSIQVPAILHHLLEHSNLLMYETALLDQGADDVNQLVDLTPEEFQQLCSMIGMDKKPFHVLRLKKALEKFSTDPNSIHTTNTSLQLPPITIPKLSTSSQVYTTRDITNFSLPNPNLIQVTAPIPVTLLQSPVISNQSQMSVSKLFLPSYLLPDSEISDFSPLVDSQTPVQVTLDHPPPFKPSTWDGKRQAIIRKYASIYGRHLDKRQKSAFEEHVNEAAYQLCLRDPTLLVRRDELFLLSKRAVKEGYSHSTGESKTPNTNPLMSKPVIGEKRTWDTSTSSSQPSTPETPSSTAKNLTTGTAKSNQIDVNNRLSGKERVNRMHSLQFEIEANKEVQKKKFSALDEARTNENHSLAFNLQLEVESLGIECQELESAYSLLKRKQARSNRYYRDKTKTKSTNEEESENLSYDHNTVFRRVSDIPRSPIPPIDTSATDSTLDEDVLRSPSKPPSESSSPKPSGLK